MKRAVVRALSSHAGYACQRTGACCARGWPIPVESDAALRIEGARLAQGIDGGRLSHDATGRCAFLRGELGARTTCQVQAGPGVAAMPMSCRHFPRVYCLDPGVTAMTLSHACSTVAAGIDVEEAASMPLIVDVPQDHLPAPPEGLDGRGVMPPLLVADVLMSWEAVTLWEELAVETLLHRGESVLDGLACLVDAAERLRGWRPGQDALGLAVRAAFDGASSQRVGALARLMQDVVALDALRARVVSVLPPGNRDLWDSPQVGRAAPFLPWEAQTQGLRRFLASHAWASWPGRMGGGVRTAAANVVVALAILAGELGRCEGATPLASAAMRTDVLLRHLSSPIVLAKLLSGVEVEGAGSHSALAGVWLAA